MDKKVQEQQLKVGQVWRRTRKINGAYYEIYFMLKTKNSNNMWLLEMVMCVPDHPEKDNTYFPKEEWWSKERVVEYMELVSKFANIPAIRVLFG